MSVSRQVIGLGAIKARRVLRWDADDCQARALLSFDDDVLLRVRIRRRDRPEATNEALLSCCRGEHGS